MKAAFINDNIQTRKKLFYKLGLILIISISINFSRYFVATDDYKSGLKHSKHWFSYNEFVIWSIIITVIISFIAIYSKIIKRINVDSENNFLEVKYIRRFKISSVTGAVKLSETLIQIEETESNKRYSQDKKTDYYLHFTHKNLGHLKISAQDFKNIKDICSQFQLLKEATAIKSRQIRLLRKKPKRKPA